jgi:pyruvyltransferase
MTNFAESPPPFLHNGAIPLYAYGFRPWPIAMPLRSRMRKALWVGRHLYRRIHHRHNFGDYLSADLVRSIAIDPVAIVDEHRSGKFLAIGSVLWALEDGDVVWGSGALNDKPLPPRRNVRCLAVRGPLTERVLIQQGSLNQEAIKPLYFDPAILVGRIYAELRNMRPVENRTLVIPHYSDWHHLHEWRSHGLFNSDCEVVNPLDHPRSIARRIAMAGRVISSSLHGLIVAESLGIAAIPFKLTDNREPSFKYEDYYAGSGRPTPLFRNTLQSALDSEAPVGPKWDDAFLRRALASFPYPIRPSLVAK